MMYKIEIGSSTDSGFFLHSTYTGTQEGVCRKIEDEFKFVSPLSSQLFNAFLEASASGKDGKVLINIVRATRPDGFKLYKIDA